ncbi:hypothetical protein SteCoe_20383 [Stentor coeruleus]|uniref:Myb-like DNA-binding domain containing protein n=1 Tax=Stentor coeruleus TaxID=5963 RepID=A0A1R2BSL3_9CILI|nr:hypothetical protein SteCoe_20383 [Stentor coeruleus]
MNPNHLYSWMFLNFNPYIQQNYPQNWSQTSIQEPELEKPSAIPKKYHRTWKKNQIEQVFNQTSAYCQLHNLKIEALTLMDFEKIAKDFEQTPEQVMIKVNEINRSGTLRPGIWSQNEDELLNSVLKKGLEKWGQIAGILNKEIHKGLKIRTGKQCKERWNNYLNPEVNRGSWTEDEDITALESYKMHGNKWSIISKSISKRTESAVKNRIKSLINKIKQDLSSIDDLEAGINKVIEKKKKKLRENEVQDSVSPRSGTSFIVSSVNYSQTFSQACMADSLNLNS